MATPRRFSNLAVETTLGVAHTVSVTTLTVVSTAGWPVPPSGYVSTAVIDPDNPSTMEVVTYTGVAGNTLTGLTRGQDGTAAKTYNAGVKVVHAISATDIEGGNGVFAGAVVQDSTLLGVQAGEAGTPRIVLSDGDVTRNWQIDNNFGVFRWFTPGVERMTLRPNSPDTNQSVLNLPSGVITVAGRQLVSGYVNALSLPTLWCAAPCSTTLALTLNTLYLAPLWIDRSIAIDSLAVSVTTAGAAGATVRLGIYEDDGRGYPGVLRVDAGTVSSTAIGAPAAAVAETLTAGLYWIGMVAQSVTCTVRAANSPYYALAAASASAALGTTQPKCYTQTGVAGALPATFSTTVTPSAVASPTVAYRRSG